MKRIPKDMIKEFEDWASEQVARAAKCSLQSVQGNGVRSEARCYPSISDSSCIACFDADRKGEAYAR